MTLAAPRPRLTIDLAPMLEPHWTGIPVFTRRLVQALQRDGGTELSFSHNLRLIEPGQVAAIIRHGTGIFLRDTLERDGRVGHKLLDPSSALLSPSVKADRRVAAREASTVHDMSTLFMPETHDEVNVAHHLDHLADEIASNEVTFCVSEATRAALNLAFPSAASRSRTLYQYVDWPADFEGMDRNLPDVRLGRYAVVLGTLEPRKNLGLVVEAFRQPELARSSLRFVVIGRRGWKIDAFLDGLTPEQTARVSFSGFISEFMKYRLIRHASFLICPSIYEGFGIPALEAMSLGKPVLAARTSSFPEVIGDAGVYFDPLSVADFAAALAVIEQPSVLKELAPKARKNSRAFHWRRMARPVLTWLRDR